MYYIHYIYIHTLCAPSADPYPPPQSRIRTQPANSFIPAFSTTLLPPKAFS